MFSWPLSQNSITSILYIKKLKLIFSINKNINIYILNKLWQYRHQICLQFEPIFQNTITKQDKKKKMKIYKCFTKIYIYILDSNELSISQHLLCPIYPYVQWVEWNHWYQQTIRPLENSFEMRQKKNQINDDKQLFQIVFTSCAGQTIGAGSLLKRRQTTRGTVYWWTKIKMGKFKKKKNEFDYHKKPKLSTYFVRVRFVVEILRVNQWCHRQTKTHQTYF